MQLTGDAGLEVRIPVKAGSQSGRRFVRAGNVGARRPAATGATGPRDLERPGVHGLCQRGLGRKSADLTMTPAPAKTPGRTAPAARRFSFASLRNGRTSEEERPARPRFSPEWRAWLIAVRSRRRTSDTLLEFFDKRPQGWRQLRQRNSVRARTHAGGSRISCCACIAIRPKPASRTASYRLSDLELASRLSFFLWSSIPDDRLLTLAEHGELSQSGDARKGSPAHAGGSARDRCAGATISPPSG